jgi:7-alpha-hydroxysteroid dehydrogenase
LLERRVILERFRLDGKVAVVTGGGRGIGRASALALAEAGADVVIAARRPDTLEEVALEIRALGRRALTVPTDVNDTIQLDRLVERTMTELGAIDVLVNNAGGSPPTIALGLSDSDFEAAYHFNVTSALHLSRACAPILAKKGGSIVNISSAMSHVVDIGFVAYGAAKAALNHMTRLLAIEWAPKIRVNAIAVGATLTDALEFVASMDSLKAQMVERTPMGRLGSPEDIAATVLFLASDASSWTTGKILEVDGGALGSVWPIKIPGGLE